MKRALFVTSSGTGVGKTFVTARLAAGLARRGRRVTALKPVLSGFDPADPTNDARVLLAACGRAETMAEIEKIAPWRFAAPLSPDMAAAREGRRIDPAALVDWCRRAMARNDHDLLLIEGVGGVLVPLAEDFRVADWIAALGVPALLVLDSALGALSHGFAAFEALRTRAIPVAGVVVSESPVQPVPLEETVAAFARFIDAPVLPLPRIGDDPARAAAEHDPARRLLDLPLLRGA